MSESKLRELPGLEEMRAIEGPIRISLHSSVFLLNDLALPSISSKPFRFHSVLFSIPTAHTSFLFQCRWACKTRKAAKDSNEKRKHRSKSISWPDGSRRLSFDFDFVPERHSLRTFRRTHWTLIRTVVSLPFCFSSRAPVPKSKR